ncbi:hypothetical protein FVF58_47090 [Paraburkholderia panacisoli]|uniref:Uncharacterized protein n=1 Tax=Paraburkholderia panacisoli TaxID=2603818 RepID=A0A5B0G375_9BURK|nr:hypothetical protein [Paraburkholderia panacisoli]KAA0997884.1 hypothetical protein FVF58_47090 [Paraburkholderia panacisoli]
MSPTTPIRHFAETIKADRRERLLSYGSFDEIERMIAASEATAVTWEPFSGELLKGCHRASFLLRVSIEAYDAFFNSLVGYRAQFAISIGMGEQANRRLLATLEPRLIVFGLARSGTLENQLVASLRGEEAKLWIDESEVETQLGEDCAAILYPRWLRNTENGVGLLAPYGEKLVVCGGWLDAQGNAHKNPLKAHRSEEIHNTGYS